MEFGHRFWGGGVIDCTVTKMEYIEDKGERIYYGDFCSLTTPLYKTRISITKDLARICYDNNHKLKIDRDRKNYTQRQGEFYRRDSIPLMFNGVYWDTFDSDEGWVFSFQAEHQAGYNTAQKQNIVYKRITLAGVNIIITLHNSFYAQDCLNIESLNYLLNVLTDRVVDYLYGKGISKFDKLIQYYHKVKKVDAETYGDSRRKYHTSPIETKEEVKDGRI